MIYRLQANRGYKWRHENGAYLKGAPYLGSRKLGIADFFSAVLTGCKNGHPEINELALARIEGPFAFVVAAENRAIIISDRTNSFPIYYNTSSSVISDAQGFDFADAYCAGCIDPAARLQFLYANNVFGEGTLLKSWNRTSPASITEISGRKGISVRRYERLRYCGSNLGLQEGIRHISSAYESTLAFLKASAGEYERVVVPLSGGFDSRHVLLLLHEAGIRDVSTFFVGGSGNPSEVISRNVSKHFGFPWAHINYSANYWRGKFHSEDRAEYSRYAGGIHTVGFHLDWPALQHGLWPREGRTLFIPGHGGDFIAGSFVTPEARAMDSEESLLEKVYSDFARNCIVQFNKRSVMTSIKNVLSGAATTITENDWLSRYESFIWEQRFCSHVLNSVRAYEYFSDSEWLLPLASGALIRAHYAIDPEFRVNRRLYKQYCQREFGSIFGDTITRNWQPTAPMTMFQKYYGKMKNYNNKTFRSPYLPIHPIKMPAYWARNRAYINSFIASIELSEKERRLNGAVA